MTNGLFDLPEGTRVPPRRIVLLTGPSGSGKTSLTRRLGLPVVELDDFYHDADHAGLPRRFGIVDWDSPGSWDSAARSRRCSRSRRQATPTSRSTTSRRRGARAPPTSTSPGRASSSRRDLRRRAGRGVPGRGHPGRRDLPAPAAPHDLLVPPAPRPR
ncbi:hypothetical protein NKG05_07195 [Oerskovia sp. M15]